MYFTCFRKRSDCSPTHYSNCTSGGSYHPTYLCYCYRNCCLERAACYRNMDTYQEPGCGDFYRNRNHCLCKSFARRSYLYFFCY